MRQCGGRGREGRRNAIGERSIAYGYCRAEAAVLTFEHTGYDPELATHSPGIFLLHEMLMRIFAERRFRVFDFGFRHAF